MGLTAQTKQALRISLGHQAGGGVIGILERLADEPEASPEPSAPVEGVPCETEVAAPATK